jgi:hypothetical protein
MNDEPASSTEPDQESDEPSTAEDIARELRANLSAIYVDTWVTLTWKGHVRFVVGERLYRKSHYRSAFVMELDDAEAFARHLLGAVERRRTKDTERTKKDQDMESDT